MAISCWEGFFFPPYIAFDLSHGFLFYC
jgi:hypothetical protein